jgi:glycosyltransferase involved in cell wall biosynthesis
MPMKILHIISSVNPEGGGPIEGVKQLASVWSRVGHEIEIASLDTPAASHVKTFSLPIYPLGPAVLRYGYSSRFLPWLRENASNYDAVIVNGLWQYHSFGARRVLHSSGIPYFIFTHGMLDPWFKRTYPLKHLKKWLYWPWADYRVLRDARAVLFTCEEERVLARQSFWFYKCNEVVVNYGTASPPDNPEAQERAFYDRFSDLQGKRLALFVGRIHPKKGCDLAIQAFAKVLSKDPDWHLIMAGPDQVGWQADLSALAKGLNIDKHITFAGMINGDVKWGAFRASEIFLLPSHQENFGIAVAEALAVGVPSLISNKVNIWREIERDGAGIVAEDNLEGTCALLNTWMSMSNVKKSLMGRRAINCFRERFEIHKAADTLMRVLSKEVDNRAREYALA